MGEQRTSCSKVVRQGKSESDKEGDGSGDQSHCCDSFFVLRAASGLCCSGRGSTKRWRKEQKGSTGDWKSLMSVEKRR